MSSVPIGCPLVENAARAETIFIASGWMSGGKHRSSKKLHRIHTYLEPVTVEHWNPWLSVRICCLARAYSVTVSSVKPILELLTGDILKPSEEDTTLTSSERCTVFLRITSQLPYKNFWQRPACWSLDMGGILSMTRRRQNEDITTQAYFL